MRQLVLQPGDTVVALELVRASDQAYRRLANRLHLSAGFVHKAVQRLREAELLLPESKRVNQPHLREFVIHGVRFAYPAVVGPSAAGVPTAYSAPPLAEEIVSSESVVWPSARGTQRGDSLVPLYPGAPNLVHTAPVLYRVLALVDALRVGRARERKRAVELLVCYIKTGELEC